MNPQNPSLRGCPRADKVSWIDTAFRVMHYCGNVTQDKFHPLTTDEGTIVSQVSLPLFGLDVVLWRCDWTEDHWPVVLEGEMQGTFCPECRTVFLVRTMLREVSKCPT